MPDQPQDGAELLARIKPRLAEDWYEVVLRPDLRTAFEEAHSDYLQAKASDGSRTDRVGAGTESAETKRLKKKAEKIAAEMTASAVRFVFRARNRDAFRALCDQHEPREDDRYDHYVGYNRQAVSDALVRESLIDPVFDDESWEQLVDVLGPGQWAKLREIADELNEAVVQPPPKGLLA